MLNDLLLHTRTREQLERLIADPSHAILLLGQSGSGKKYTARTLAAAVLGLADEALLGNYPYATILEPAGMGNTITIEAIRGAQNLLTLKTPKPSRTDNQPAKTIRRIIVIYEAGRMGGEAQNAFLKTLEEPPADTCIIMTCAVATPVLPTIRSRAQVIDILPVTAPECINYYNTLGLYEEAEVQKAYALAAGQVGLLNALLTDTDHVLKAAVDSAKTLLGATQFERLAKADEISKDKASIALLLDALGRISRAALRASAAKNTTPALQRWHKTLGLVTECQAALAKSANPKLLLTNLFLQL